MAGIVFVKKLLSTRSPKLRLLCRLIVFFNKFNVLGKRHANVLEIVSIINQVSVEEALVAKLLVGIRQ